MQQKVPIRQEKKDHVYPKRTPLEPEELAHLLPQPLQWILPDQRSYDKAKDFGTKQ